MTIQLKPHTDAQLCVGRGRQNCSSGGCVRAPGNEMREQQEFGRQHPEVCEGLEES